MSRYFAQALIVLVLLVGCATKRPSAESPDRYRSFDQEDTYILEALFYKNHGDYAKAYALFDELYKKTNNPEYRIEAVKLLVAAQRYREADKILKELLSRQKENAELYRLMAFVKLKLGDIDAALLNAQKAYTLQPNNARNVDLMASLYLAKGDNQKAYDLYAKAYAKNHDDATVVKMASILYQKFDNPQDAIRLLETHSKMIGCSENVCLFLAELYRQAKDLDHLADVYTRIYEKTHRQEYAQKAAEIYAYKKEYSKAEKLLVTSHADDRLLLAIYKHTKQFDKAAKLAQKLYIETSDPLWLAEHGVLLYEGAPRKSDPKLLKTVIHDLSTAFKKGVNDPLYYNYLGYLLIDHDIDVGWGIELVKKALAAEPNSAFYIDSLAWGYYKTNRCEKAYEQMKRVVDMIGLKDKEVKKHWDKIKQCRSRKK